MLITFASLRATAGSMRGAGRSRDVLTFGMVMLGLAAFAMMAGFVVLCDRV